MARHWRIRVNALQGLQAIKKINTQRFEAVLKLLRKNIKLLSMVGLVILGCGLMYGLVHLGLLSPFVNSAVLQPESIRYVLVNEDLGATFNEQEYNLGAEFVNLINQDPNRRWHTASRSVATAGLRAGSYDVKIILPQNFSERLLSLQSLTPEQAQIIFEVRAGQNDLVNAAILESVGEILNDFNVRIIQMYFSSILNNIYEAQRNVESMIAIEQGIKNTLLNDIHIPFAGLPYSFLSTIEQSEQLAYQNRNWQEQQDEFTQQTQELLQTSAGELADYLGEFVEYMELMGRISQLNLETTMTAMERQSEEDEAFYRGFFDELNRTGNEQFRGFLAKDEYGHLTGAMVDLAERRSEFAEAQAISVAAIQAQTYTIQAGIGVLRGLAESLSDLRADIAEAYFYSRNITPQTATAHDIRRAILAMAELNEQNESRLAEAYFLRLHNDISDLATKDIAEMLEALRAQVEQELLDTYKDALYIVDRYIRETEGLTSGGHQFVLLVTDDKEYPEYHGFGQKLTFSLSTEVANIITIYSPDANITICLEDGALVDRVRAKLRGSFHGYEAEGWAVNIYVEKSSASELEIGFSFEEPPQEPCCRKPCNSTEASVPQDPGNCCSEPCGSAACKCIPPQFSEIPPYIGLTTQFTRLWHFCCDGSENIYSFADVYWHLNGETVNSGRIHRFADLSYVGLVFLQNDFAALLGQLHLLDSVVRQIIFIFGAADENAQTISEFHYYIAAQTGKEQTIRSLAPQSSIYRRVGTLTIEEQKELISDSLADLFKAQGTALFHDVDMHYSMLREAILDGEAVIEALTEVIEYLPSPQTLLNEVNRLMEWQALAREALDHAHNAWVESPAVPILIAEYSTRVSGGEGELAIFNESTVGFELFMDMSMQMGETIAYAEMAALAAASIESLDYQFGDLVAQTEQVKGYAGAVLEDMGSLLYEYAAAAGQNVAFSDNFSTVMENARIGGVENRQVQQFLADPIIPQGILGVAETATVIPYFMTIIGALLSLAVGYSLRYVETNRKLREEHKMLTPSRIWFNTPEAAKVSAVAILIGAIFGIATLGAVPFAQIAAWIIYVVLVTLASILLVAFFARQFPKLALYATLGLVGMYLLLTPILGMTITPNSFVEVLFQLSLLQNVENGYMQLVQGSPVGWLAYFVLCLLVIGGVMLNLLVKKKKKEAVTP